jgi:hypothetical protein
MSLSAELKSYDPNYRSPFTVDAEKHGKKSIGGKPDDITVIVSQIKLK